MTYVADLFLIIFNGDHFSFWVGLHVTRRYATEDFRKEYFSRFRNFSYECSATIGCSVMLYSLHPYPINELFKTERIFQFELIVHENSAFEQKNQ